MRALRLPIALGQLHRHRPSRFTPSCRTSARTARIVAPISMVSRACPRSGRRAGTWRPRCSWSRLGIYGCSTSSSRRQPGMADLAGRAGDLDLFSHGWTSRPTKLLYPRQHLLDAAGGLAEALLILDQGDADEAFALLAEADAGATATWARSAASWRTPCCRDAGTARGSAPRRTCWPSARECPSRRGRSIRPARRGASCRAARLASTQSCGPLSAATAAAWIGVKAP